MRGTALHINSEREKLQCGVSQANSDSQAFLGRLRSPSLGWRLASNEQAEAFLPSFPKLGGAGDRPAGTAAWTVDLYTVILTQPQNVP